MKAAVSGRFWTPAEDAELIRRYPSEPAKVIAKDIHRGVRAVYMRANLHGLRKVEGFASRCTKARWVEGRHEGSRNAHFKPGHVAFNKGKPAKGWNPNIANCRATQFKKGQLSGAAMARMQPIGATRIADGQLIKKINNDTCRPRRWVSVARLVWEAECGPIPKGQLVIFKRGLATTVEAEITIDRLELVTRAENMRRNSYHNYPQPIPKLMQLRGALTRQINRRDKDEKQNRGSPQSPIHGA